MDEKKYPSHTLDKFQLRFPEGMRDKIREAAEASGRSMNSEIIHRLELSFQAEKFGILDAEKVEFILDSQMNLLGALREAISRIPTVEEKDVKE